MASKAVRKRINHGDLDERSSHRETSDSDNLNEPLLGSCDHNESHPEEERLRMLRHRAAIPFDGSLVDHQDALKQLWRLAFPNRELPPLKSDLWKEMGWQGSDPSTDFRSGGLISLENLIYFAKNYPNAFNSLLHKLDGKRTEWEYPFAIAGINISYMLTKMLELQSGKITSRVGYRFLELNEKDDAAFDKLYCVAFQMLDSEA